MASEIEMLRLDRGAHLSRCIGKRAAGVAAITGDFHIILPGIFAILATVLIVLPRHTFTGGMGAFLCGAHGNVSFSVSYRVQAP